MLLFIISMTILQVSNANTSCNELCSSLQQKCCPFRNINVQCSNPDNCTYVDSFCKATSGLCNMKKRLMDPLCLKCKYCLPADCWNSTNLVTRMLNLPTCSKDATCLQLGKFHCDFFIKKCQRQKELGRACLRDTECLSNICLINRCVDRVPEIWQSCETQFECSPYEFCQNGSCTPLKESGSKCETHNQCESLICRHGRCDYCEVDSECTSGRFCDVPGGGSCLPIQDDYGYCDRHLGCVSGKCSNYTCVSLYVGNETEMVSTRNETVPISEENVLQLYADLPDNECFTDQSCSSNDLPRFCDFLNGTCQPQKKIGESCIRDTQCESGLCGENQCVVATSLPLQCNNTSDCNYGQFCENWKCFNKKQVGENCINNEDCQTGLCMGNICEKCTNSSDCHTSSHYCSHPVSVYCLPVLQVGAPCDRDVGCLSENCSNDGRCSCLYDIHCPSGHFCDPADWNCEQKHEFGGSCLDDEMCNSGRCHDRKCQ